MSTNSTITVQVSSNEFLTVYCHWDGYLDGVGATLKKHYRTLKDVLELVKLGDVSALYESCDRPEGHTFDTAVKGYTIFYGRDRQEDNVGVATIDRPSDIGSQEFNYLFKGGNWFVATGESTSFKLYNTKDES